MHDCVFVVYVDWISVAAAVVEITWYRFIFAERDVGVGLWQIPRILLSSVSQHHECTVECEYQESGRWRAFEETCLCDSGILLAKLDMVKAVLDTFSLQNWV